MKLSLKHAPSAARIALAFALFFTGDLVWAGYMEIGVSGSYRKSFIDEKNYQESTSLTGSVSYYFWELSALELSYTQGGAKIVLQPEGEVPVTTITNFEAIGLDLVVTFADRAAFIQPYGKLGAAYISKKIKRKAADYAAYDVASESTEGISPTAGAGLKFKLTDQFSVKFGGDVWWSPLGKEPMTTDYAFRVGVSWLF
jgi:opacity protein-like surface antigen